MEIASGDVIRLMLQFLKENGLHSTLRTLQEESSIALNTVDNMDIFMADILNGSWDKVLTQVAKLKLPTEKLVQLYEQIVVELIELRDIDTARTIMKDTPPMQYLKEHHQDRFLRLQHVLNRPYWDATYAYPDGSTKDQRRADIAAALAPEVCVVPPSRLLSLLGHSLRWQRHMGLLPPGNKYDLFRGAAPSRKDDDEVAVKDQRGVIKFGKKSYAECSAFSPDGAYLVSGSVDGFLEVWDFETCKLNKQLQYQRDDELMMHDETILCTVFSRDSELIASGSKDGNIKIWKVTTGECLRKFPKAHSLGISSLAFSRDCLQVASSSFDTLVRIHGLKSGRTIKEFRGHSSYVNCVVYNSDFTKLITASADGTVKLWDTKSSDCIHSFRLPSTGAAGDVAVNSIVLVPRHTDQMVVCNNSNKLYLTSITGSIVRELVTEKEDEGHFIAALFSPQGKYVYGLTEKGKLYCFMADSGKVESCIQVCTSDPRSLSHHPHMNLVGSSSSDGTLVLWS